MAEKCPEKGSLVGESYPKWVKHSGEEVNRELPRFVSSGLSQPFAPTSFPASVKSARESWDTPLSCG